MMPTFLTMGILSLIVLMSPKPQCGYQYFFEQGYNPDAFEYFMPAANLALHNKFPYYGFISNMNSYHLHPNPESVKYFADTYTAGNMVFVSKPPLYSLLLALCFKRWGVLPCVPAWLNLCCLWATMGGLLWAGYLFTGYPGLLCCLPAIGVYYGYMHQAIWNTDAELLTSVLIVLNLIVGTWVLKNKSFLRYVLFGCCMAILALCKAYFVMSLYGIVLLLAWWTVRNKTFNKFSCLIGFIAGAFCIMLPWVFYINHLLQSDIPNRLAFSEKLKATTPQLFLLRHSEIYDQHGQFRADVIENMNKFHQYQHARENGFTFISNQNGEYNILNVHNEFCTDGDFHPEWRIIQNSFYNHHLVESRTKKIWLFYTQYPLLGLKITVAKFGNVMNSAGIIFYIALFVVLPLLWLQHNILWMPVAFFLWTIPGVIIVLYGDERFVLTVLPVALFTIALGLYGFILHLIKR